MTAETPIGPAGLSITEQDLVARLRLAMGRLARQQRRSYPSGLTPSQQSALAIIDRHGPVRLSDLARYEAVAPPTITRIVAKLEAEGLVERRGDENDRRIARVSITEAGHLRMVETREGRNQWLGAKLTELPPDDLASILAAVEPLERLVETARTDGRDPSPAADDAQPDGS